MGMLGNQIAAGTQLTVANDSFNGDGSTTAFTLSQTVSATTDIEVLVDNVQQSPYDGSYSVSGTTLTFSGTPSAGTNNIYVIYNASKHITTQQVIPDDGSVTHSKFHTTALNPITLDQTNNRVGVGTVSPSQALHVVGEGFFEKASADSVVGVTSTGGSGRTYQIRSQTSGEFYLYDSTAGASRLTVDSSGRVTMPNQPGFKCKPTYTASVDMSNWHIIALSAANDGAYNIGNHLDFTNNRFTAPVAGKYAFTCQLRTDGFNGSYIYWDLRKNSGGVAGNGDRLARTLTSLNYTYHTSSLNAIVYLYANDYVDWHIRSVGDTSVTIDNDCDFFGCLIG